MFYYFEAIKYELHIMRSLGENHITILYDVIESCSQPVSTELIIVWSLFKAKWL